ncbi:MAG: PDZ domain-containing protein [Firmicutes bacterium]|nr:PDZ domain-containing protein [Bacillota bacterium]
MDFFNGFYQPRRSLWGNVLSALFGTLVGGALVAFILLRFFVPGQEAAQNQSNIVPQTQQPSQQQEEIPFNEQDRPEYQNTAVVRAAEKVVPAVVGITNKVNVFSMFHGRTVLQDKGTGSGVIIDPDGYIVTNNHVIEGADEIWVTLGDEKEYKAELVGKDRVSDLAVIKINAANLTAATFGDSDKIVVGEMAIAIGNPLGLRFSQSVTVGYISSKQREITDGTQTLYVIQTDAAINSGNSGGPLVNLKGEVIGINTAKIMLTGVEGMGFAIPSNTVKKVAEELIAKGYVVRPRLGVYNGGDIDAALAKQLQLPVDYGMIVYAVDPGSPADKAGMRSGDIIIEFAGKKIETFSDLQKAIYAQKVGDTVEIVVVRDRQKLTLTATLTEAANMDD